MKKAFQITRSLKSLSVSLLMAIMVFFLCGTRDGYSIGPSDNCLSSSYPETKLIPVAIFHDSPVFALMPERAKMVVHSFNLIGFFLQVKSWVGDDTIDVPQTRFIGVFFRNIYQTFIRIHAP